MKIKTVTVIGLGALGVLFSHHLSERMTRHDLRILADRERIERYRREQVFCNGEACSFCYTSPQDNCPPADLFIFAVKYGGLQEAVASAKNHIGKHTVIISLLNGISSEEIIGGAYGMDNVVYCVAQGMDAVKEGNRLTYEHMGMLCFGKMEKGASMEKIQAVADFFISMEVPCLVESDMARKMWGKFMVNVGVNQTVAILGTDYGSVQAEGKARDVMVSAMKEVIVLSGFEGVCLSGEDLAYWLHVISTLSPRGKPSMRQDIEAKRHSEVELFAGTVRRLGEKHRVKTPVNDMLYQEIKKIESRY
ncbi:MAG: ketopantoate reductase family protein [Christensenellales bacterium]